MPTTTFNATAMRYHGGSWTNGQARQGFYNNVAYRGEITFDFSSVGDVSNINISSIVLRFTVGTLGGAYTKYLYLHTGSYNGTSAGNYSFSSCYNTSKSITFSANSNSGGFNTLKAYIEGGGTKLGTYTGSSRGSGSSKSYDYDYMNITAMSLEITYSYKKSSGTIGSAKTGDTITLNINSFNNTYKHKVTWKLGSWSSTSTISAGIDIAQTTIPHSALPNSTSGTATVILETLNGSTSLGSNTYSFAVSVPTSIVPSIGTFSSIAKLNTSGNRQVTSTAAGWGLYIKHYSWAHLSISNASAGEGATLKTYTITSGAGATMSSGSSGSISSGSATADSDWLEQSGTITFTAKVTDSRGRTATSTLNITVRDYAFPKIISTPQVYRCDINGNKKDIEGTYAKVTVSFSYSSVNSQNSLTVKRITLNNVNTNISSGTASIIGAGALEVDRNYNAVVTLKDAVGNTTNYTVNIPSASYILHIHRGGNSLGIGRAANTIGDNRVHVGWAATFYDDMSVNGALAARGGASVTGNISATGTLITNGNNYIKRTDINGKSATNGISSNLYPGIFTRDNNDEWTTAFRGIAYTDGSFASNLAVRNYVDSAWSEKTVLACRYYKDGTVEYTVQSTPFRKALGLGTNGALPITVGQGGTNATTALEARTNLQAALGKYTSGEVDTGCTWVDGKEIYRYVWTGSKVISGAQVEMFTMSVTPVKIIDIRGIRTRSNSNSWPIPYSYYNNQNWDMGIYYDSSDKKVYVNAGSGYGSTSDSFIIILEYTKS